MSNKSPNKEKLCTCCETGELSRIRNFVQNKALSFGFKQHEAQKIALAVDEACTNLIKHAFHFDIEKDICVEIETKSNRFTVIVLDDGDPFDPLSFDEPNMKEYFEKYKKGGLGIVLMKKVMDEISYKPSNKKNSQNVLKLTKILVS